MGTSTRMRRPDQFIAMQNPHDFSHRHLGPAPVEQEEMLRELGCESVEQLVEEAVPAGIRLERDLDLPPALSESAALDRLRSIVAENQVCKSFIGAGYHGTITPPVIQRNVFENPGWYTAYTPYQAEIAQGRLEALLNFQTMVTDLTGLDVANASLLDEGTAVAEAISMAAAAKPRSRVVFVSDRMHPQTIDVVRTRVEPLDLESGDRPVAGLRCPAHVMDWPRWWSSIRTPWGRSTTSRGSSSPCTRRGAGDRRGGSAGADPAEAAGRIRRGPVRRELPEVWRADGLRRPARRLHCLPGRIEAPAARAPGRRLAGCARQAGLPARPADPRAAHPARQGDLEHLHRAGAARGDGGDVCDLSRAGGLRAIAGGVHRKHRGTGRCAEGGGIELENGAFFDTIVARCRPRRRDVLKTARSSVDTTCG
jgi:hypothetical protein